MINLICDSPVSGDDNPVPCPPTWAGILVWIDFLVALWWLSGDGGYLLAWVGGPAPPSCPNSTRAYIPLSLLQFWQCGQWVEVVIDDRLPVLNNEYFFVNPRNKQEFWPSLLEKACAK